METKPECVRERQPDNWARFKIEREPASPQSPHPEVTEHFRSRTVLITGASGSIGSELARQVASLPIARLLLLDRDENSMFELLRSFDKQRSAAPMTSIVGDIRDSQLIDHIFDEWRPGIVLHAAAYKHVPMMEANPCEAVLNNVTGTRILADAAIGHGCERFLLISTDKAVEPSSVMGATKRLAELLVQQLSACVEAGQTVLASVRFVNVIGSRGSVVPIFLEQIAAGGPVTVTDEKMTRYFMSLQQAARLLLQAATLDAPGAIYALETGDPVRIIDLARQLIEQSGLVPGKDTAIELTGPRPGEKLTEQLHSASESLVPTIFPGIERVIASQQTSLDPNALDALESAAQSRNAARVIDLLRQLPIEYSGPSAALSTRDPAASEVVAPTFAKLY
jgi:FlaA1/EpsC-like NDP-sugar epimerase